MSQEASDTAGNAAAPDVVNTNGAKGRVCIKKFEPRKLGVKSWGEEWLVALTDTYLGKVLHMDAGASGPLQYHERKDETFHLLSGRALVRYVDADNKLRTAVMYPGQSYHVPPGAVHQVEALEDCIFVEASNPAFDDRVRVDAASFR